MHMVTQGPSLWLITLASYDKLIKLKSCQFPHRPRPSLLARTEFKFMLFYVHGLRPHYIRTFRSSGRPRRVPGEIKRSRDLRGGRWSWTLNFAQKRSWVGRWRWAEQVGRLLLRVVQVVRQQRCNRHCLSDSVQHSSWKSNCAVHKSLGNGEWTPP